MEKPDQRQELAKDLMCVYWDDIDRENPTCMTQSALRLADWVIADRKRVCGPLVNLEPQMAHGKTIEAIKETLKLAGLE